MDNSEVLALVVFLLTLVLALVSWGFQIVVARKLKKVGIDPGAQVGRRSWIAPFVVGWKQADDLDIQELMIVWSVILGLTILGVIGTALLFATTVQP
jgi:hypothetical protein